MQIVAQGWDWVNEGLQAQESLGLCFTTDVTQLLFPQPVSSPASHILIGSTSG